MHSTHYTIHMSSTEESEEVSSEYLTEVDEDGNPLMEEVEVKVPLDKDGNVIMPEAEESSRGFGDLAALLGGGSSSDDQQMVAPAQHLDAEGKYARRYLEDPLLFHLLVTGF